MMPTKMGRMEYGESSCGSTADSDAFPLEYQGGVMANGWGSQSYVGGRNGYHDTCMANPHEQQQGLWKTNMTIDSLRPNIDQMSSWRQQEEQHCGTSVLDACREINKKAREDEVLGLRLKLEKRQAALEAKAKRLGMQGIQRSGKRKEGEGVEDAEQGILDAMESPNGGAELLITLLAAGFIIGPSGSSVRAISTVSGSMISSWNETFRSRSKERKVRRVVVEGPVKSVLHALNIIKAAVNRYKELCEGKYCGKSVERIQQIYGVDFYYSPPPRNAVPFAASLKVDKMKVTALGEDDPLYNKAFGKPRRQKEPAVEKGKQCYVSPSDASADIEAWYTSAVQEDLERQERKHQSGRYANQALGLYEVPNLVYEGNKQVALPSYQRPGSPLRYGPQPYQLFSAAPAPHNFVVGYTVPHSPLLQNVSVHSMYPAHYAAWHNEYSQAFAQPCYDMTRNLKTYRDIPRSEEKRTQESLLDALQKCSLSDNQHYAPSESGSESRDSPSKYSRAAETRRRLFFDEE
eukprot:jgi/Picsp_1/667/NSC_00662-R1_protein